MISALHFYSKDRNGLNKKDFQMEWCQLYIFTVNIDMGKNRMEWCQFYIFTVGKDRNESN